jgi:hypothetical protein
MRRSREVPAGRGSWNLVPDVGKHNLVMNGCKDTRENGCRILYSFVGKPRDGTKQRIRRLLQSNEFR